MKLFRFLFLFILVSFTLTAADKPAKISDDANIIAYATLKSPADLEKKLIKFLNEISPGTGTSLQQSAAQIQPLLDDIISITAVINSKEDLKKSDPIIFISFKNKSSLENPLLALIQTKEAVDNTLIISIDNSSDSITEGKKLLKAVLKLSSQKDLEIVLDINRLINKIPKDVVPETRDIVDFMNISKQLESASITINIEEKGLAFSSNLFPLDKSNLQTAFLQPSANAKELLQIIGTGSFMTYLAKFDLTKLKGIASDIYKQYNTLKELTENDKNILKNIEASFIDLFSEGTIDVAALLNTNDGKLSSSQVIKAKNPTSLIEKALTLNKSLQASNNSEVLKKLFQNSAYNSSISIVENEKIGDSNIYKIKTNKPQIENSEEKLANDFMERLEAFSDNYFYADKNYIYFAANLETLKALAKNKMNDATIESIAFYKTGETIYIDFSISSYIELVQSLIGAFVDLSDFSQLKLPPFKVGIKADGNVSAKLFIETSTIAAIVAKTQEVLAKTKAENVVPVENNSTPEQQP